MNNQTKQTPIKTSVDLAWQLLQLLPQKELEIIQRRLEQAASRPSVKKQKSLWGIWKGIKFNENDFAKAKKSLFKEAYNWNKY